MSLSDARAADEAMSRDFARRKANGELDRKPPAETSASIRRRMAAFLRPHVAAQGNVTRAEIKGAGFTESQIDAHFEAAALLARLPQMAA